MDKNRLELIKDLGMKQAGKRKRRFGLFKCSCGNIIELRMDSFCKTLSCGCLKKEQDEKNLWHRYEEKWKYQDRRLYGIWRNMLYRCYYDDNRSYQSKNILVCDEWIDNFDVFAKWSYENGYNENLTIDRINNSGNYTPSNCRWADNKTQSNNRDSNIVLNFKGRKYTLMQLCEELNLDYKMVHARYASGERDIKRLIRGKTPEYLNNNKLIIEDVRDIRKLRKQGMSIDKINKKYHFVTKSTIYNVLKYNTWKKI